MKRLLLFFLLNDSSSKVKDWMDQSTEYVMQWYLEVARPLSESKDRALSEEYKGKDSEGQVCLYAEINIYWDFDFYI